VPVHAPQLKPGPSLIGCLLVARLAACGGNHESAPSAAPAARTAALRLGAAPVAADYTSALQSIYVGYFGRPADPAGLAYFAELYRQAGAPTSVDGISQAYNGNASVKSLIDAFATSAESQALYPGDNNTFINAIYQNLFNRPAEAAGAAYWSDLIDRGLLTRAGAALTIMSSAQSSDMTTVNNKASVAATFTASLTSPQLQAAYSGLAPNAVVRTMLGGISGGTDLSTSQGAIVSTQAAIVDMLAKTLRADHLQVMAAAPPTEFVPPLTLADVVGTYRSLPASSDPYTSGTVSLRAGSTSALQYVNQAGMIWNLQADLAHGLLLTDASNPYAYNTTSGINFKLQFQNGKLVGFRHNDNMYWRDGGAPLQADGEDQHLGGYLQASPSAAPPGYTSGYSMYTAIWPLVDPQLGGVSHGLAGTWINPDNEDFTSPLLPEGHPIRVAMPDGAATNWRTLFQSIEGSAGYWVNTHYRSSQPKFRINGTPNGYVDELSAPGWEFGRDAVAAGNANTWGLPMGSAGLAQLSNRILVPPDGMTFKADTAGELLGVSWMALPLTAAKGGATPVGNQSWTMFVKASNYQGPVAFYVPDVWEVMAQTYPTVAGRGLDVRPAQIKTLVMEMQMRYFVGKAKNGDQYMRLQRFAFPTDAQGLSYILTDFTLYSRDALFQPFLDWSNGAGAMPAKFAEGAAHLPQMSTPTFYFGNGKAGLAVQSVSGFEQFVTPKLVPTSGGNVALALQFNAAAKNGVFPEYYQTAGGIALPRDVASVPAETGLKGVSFNIIQAEGWGPEPYTSPPSWAKPAAASAPLKATLSDGSVVTYAWYRFIDQPSLQGFGWTQTEKDRLQAMVEKIHAGWTGNTALMPQPSVGQLVTLDAAILLTPPAGYEVGYVPIALSQAYY
jgi:hypothetical protein